MKEYELLCKLETDKKWLECLKKFKTGKLLANCKGEGTSCCECGVKQLIYYEIGRLEWICKDCWFKECFGEVEL